ncbi:hypothetical protein [Nocardia colli]|uniref:hypothetical protein n=1 Tax=Nocardia colli TaxID=2545717 RepID=UPI0035D58700
MRSSDFISRLRHFGALEWFRHAGGADDCGTAVPPLVVWRFAEPWPARCVELLSGIVESDDREIDWLFDTSRRNWVLVPARVMDEKTLHGFATEAQAVAFLAHEDQEFCRRSVDDFDRIIAALDRSAGG